MDWLLPSPEANFRSLAHSEAALAASNLNRRDFVSRFAGAGAGGWLAAHWTELRAVAAYAASDVSERPFDFFASHQAREFDAISAQIVPTDDTPGAREANVVRFVDRFLATVGSEWQADLLDDFRVLGEALETWEPATGSFAALSDDDQIAFLTAFEQSQRGAFNDFRELTMLGMFSHPIHGGNFDQIGWKLIGFEDRQSWEPPFGYYDRV